MCPWHRPSMRGSNTLSTSSPPRRYPTGMVKNWRVFRTEYTRPCISKGMWERKSTSILALITGINSHPRTAPVHHTGRFCPKARRKFSVLMEKRRELQIALTRLLGAGQRGEPLHFPPDWPGLCRHLQDPMQCGRRLPLITA